MHYACVPSMQSTNPTWDYITGLKISLKCLLKEQANPNNGDMPDYVVVNFPS
jgi:hypothetical protein